MKKIAFNEKGKLLELAIALIFIAIGVTFRLLPHAPNFTPIAAIALFGGVYLARKTALVLPLAAMIISDIFIGSYDPKLMIFVYGSFILCVFVGFWIKNHKKLWTILGGSVIGATMFFFITNFAVWAFTPWYAKSVSGLIQCYAMALPFFRNTLLGDLFFVVIFFGAYELIEVWVKRKFTAKATETTKGAYCR